MSEVRIVDPATGGAKGSKLARFDMIPANVLWQLAEHYGKGEQKYPSDVDGKANWRKGYKWSLSYAALQRHLQQWLMGEEFDNHLPSCSTDCKEHTGSRHLVAVLWHAAALSHFQENNLGTDDRHNSF